MFPKYIKIRNKYITLRELLLPLKINNKIGNQLRTRRYDLKIALK